MMFYSAGWVVSRVKRALRIPHSYQCASTSSKQSTKQYICKRALLYTCQILCYLSFFCLLLVYITSKHDCSHAWRSGVGITIPCYLQRTFVYLTESLLTSLDSVCLYLDRSQHTCYNSHFRLDNMPEWHKYNDSTSKETTPANTWVNCRDRPLFQLDFVPTLPIWNPDYHAPMDFIFTANDDPLGLTCPKSWNFNTRQDEFLIIVLSMIADKKPRQWIRNTWGKEIRANADQKLNNKLLFMITYPKHDSLVFFQLQKEQANYKDLLLVGTTIPDAYNLLTVRLLLMIRWFSQRLCPNQRARHLIKADQDSIWNSTVLTSLLQKASKELHNENEPVRNVNSNYDNNEDADRGSRSNDNNLGKYIIGHLNIMPPAIRNPKSAWRIYKEEYKENYFPMYANGSPGYIMSLDAVKAIFNKALWQRLLFLEDVYITGVLAEQANIKRYDCILIQFCSQLPSKQLTHYVAVGQRNVIGN